MQNRPEKFQVDADAYYKFKQAEIIAGQPTWVEDFEFDAEKNTRFSGFFRDGHLVGLVREQLHHRIPRYPMVYEMRDGNPKLIRTAETFEEAAEIVENLSN